MTLEDKGVSEIGITDESVFAVYNDTRIETSLNKEDWTETVKLFVPELNKVVPEDIVEEIIKELSLDHVELARLEKLEERPAEVHLSKEEQRIIDSVGTGSNNNEETGGGKRKSSSNQQSCSEEKTSPIEQATEYVMSKYNFATIEESREILYFSNGVYLSGGDIIIEKVTENLLGFDAATAIISEVKGHVSRLTYHKREEFDADINIINMVNGLYDIEGDELLPHDANYLSCHQIPVTYVKGAKPMLFGKFLKDVLYPRDIKTAIDIMAYTFRRDYDIEVIFTLYGIGANGKTVYTSVIICLHGPKHVSNVPLSSMAGDKDRFALSDLENKNVNIDNELDNQVINDTATLKRLTQGSRQPIRIQRKNQKAYDTILYAKLIFNANRVPYSIDRSDGYNRRMKIVVFPNQFEGENEDKKLLSKLTVHQELSGIFNVCMIALRRILKTGEIYTNEKTIEESRIKYDLVVNPIRVFLDEVLNEEAFATAIVFKPTLYDAYTKFCENHKIPVSKKYDPFCKSLKNEYDVKDDKVSVEGKKSQERVWIGITLTEEYRTKTDQTTLPRKS